MSNPQIARELSDLFESWAGERPDLVLPLAPSASSRVYYRLKKGGRSAIGTFGEDDRENRAFLSFSRHFAAKGLPVPKIHAEDLTRSIYLQEDLGTTTMYSYLLQRGDSFPDYLYRLYKKTVKQLARLQIEGGEGLDYDLCFPRRAFDRQSMMWDFNYFKYCFLKPAGLHFDEQELENDMQRLATFLLEADDDYFMYRDCQTRNIMIVDGHPHFIDYQGGRKGALQYDLASLLFQAKANIPASIREEMLEYYLQSATDLTDIDAVKFVDLYYGFVLMRFIQVLGAYGYRGLYERKDHFLKSIPYALENVRWLFDTGRLKVDLPELRSVLMKLAESEKFEPFDRSRGTESLLTVSINSFSYKKGGVPGDPSGNGGGFVFDCRGLHNPGRYETYKKLTGRDEAVINFLKQHSRIKYFLSDVYRIVDPTVENYIDRSFTHLQINFGCTGGQHRSVFAADAMARHLSEKYGVRTRLRHIVMEAENWLKN
ncbi:MAG: RNase adapter RapZ [Saprospiraceae bacterium]|nr:RNase adapter RapZ [Saprospiraceae bacterium]